jgi:hypothetical protein
MKAMPLVAVIFGWPAVIVSVLLTLAGIAATRWSLVLAGAVLGTPFLLYLFLTPRFRLVALLVAVLYFASAGAVAHRSRAIALALTAPFVVLAAFVAWLVMNQRAG